MHTVITVNLNGNAYQVEERGYRLLCDYLDAAEAQLKDNPDRAEIISDLEQAIAEKCRRFLGPQKTVVASTEIEQIIQEMGPVDGDAGSGSEGQSKTKEDAERQEKSSANAPKRLYRIRQGKKVGGVCTGLAAYLGLDVSIVRLIFVVLAVTTGVSIIAYVVMMLVVPYAQTSEEHAAAFGMAFNAQDFINQAKEHYSGFKSEIKNEGEEWKKRARGKRHDWQRSWRRSFRSPRYGWGPVPPFASPIVGSMLPIFGILAGLLTFIWIFAVISVVNTHAIFGWPLPLRFPVWVAIVILLILLNVVTGPLNYMRHARYSHPYGAVIAVWASVAWMAFLIFAAWIGYHHMPEVQSFIENLPNVWNEMVNH